MRAAPAARPEAAALWRAPEEMVLPDWLVMALRKPEPQTLPISFHKVSWPPRIGELVRPMAAKRQTCFSDGRL